MFYINTNIDPNFTDKQFYAIITANTKLRAEQDHLITFNALLLKTLINLGNSLKGIISLSNISLADRINKKLREHGNMTRLSADAVCDCLHDLEVESLIYRDHSKLNLKTNELYSGLASGDNPFIASDLLHDLYYRALALTPEQYIQHVNDNYIDTIDDTNLMKFYELVNCSVKSFEDLTNISYKENNFIYYNFDKLHNINLIYSYFKNACRDDLTNDLKLNPKKYAFIDIKTIPTRHILLNVELINMILSADNNNIDSFNFENRSIKKRLCRQLNIISEKYTCDENGNQLSKNQKFKKLLVRSKFTLRKIKPTTDKEIEEALSNEEIEEGELLNNIQQHVINKYKFNDIKALHVAYDILHKRFKKDSKKLKNLDKAHAELFKQLTITNTNNKTDLINEFFETMNKN